MIKTAPSIQAFLMKLAVTTNFGPAVMANFGPPPG